MWGYSRAELSGMPFLDLVHPADVPKSLAMFEAVGRGEATRDFENRFVHKDGSIVILMWSAYWSETDRKMFCVARDVTEGRATERALDRMGKRLQTTLECMSDAFYLLDREYCFAYLNREAERLLKVSRRDLLQRCIWEVFPEAKESEAQIQFQRCFEKNESGHFEIYYSQFERWFEFDAFPSEEGLAVYFRDSTEKKRSRDLLAESHERFLNLVRATNHAMWDWDLKREEMWWAVGFENRLGYDMAKIDPKARFWYENIHPEERERVYRSLCHCIESGGRTWGDEYRFRRADGTYAYVHDRGYIVHDEQGKPSRVVGGILDISERHEQEQKLRESEERFRQFAENVGDAFWIMDAESKELLFTNPAFRQVHGCESPVSYLDSVHPEDRDRVRRAG
jgi:PAS domain S-box-containing protein